MKMDPRVYQQETSRYIAYPLGGIGSGMFCLEGGGALSHFSLFHRPDLWNEPEIFAALSFPQDGERRAVVLEGPVPDWKVFGQREGGRGASGRTYGLPRFEASDFSARFPFGTVCLSDSGLPVSAEVIGWSPLIPNDDYNSCLPAAAVEYTLKNGSGQDLDAVFSFHCASFLRPERDAPGVCRVTEAENGLAFPYREEGSCRNGWLRIDCGSHAEVDAAWLRGHPFHHTMEIGSTSRRAPSSPARPTPRRIKPRARAAACMCRCGFPPMGKPLCACASPGMCPPPPCGRMNRS